MQSYISAIIWKIKSLFSRNNHYSSIVINSFIDERAAIRNHSRLYNCAVGKYSYVARNCLIQNTIIGKYCSISEGCNIGMPSHPTGYVSTSPVFLEGNL